MERTLYSVARDTCVKHADRVAISYFDKSVKFGRLLDYIDGFAGYLSYLGIGAGDVVTVCLPNTPNSAVVLYAINKVGAIINLTHPRITSSGLREAVAVTKSKLLINYDVHIATNGADEQYDVPMLVSDSSYFMPLYGKVYFSLTQIRGIKKNKYNWLEKYFCFDKGYCGNHYVFGCDEPAVYLPSGGTTGDPKIIMHSCYAFIRLCDEVDFFVSSDISNYGAMYSVLPMFHGFGLCMNMHMCLTYGITNVMSIKFDPKRMARAIDKHNIMLLTGVPAMYKKLLACKQFNRAKLTSLVECFVGGDDTPLQLIEQFNALMQSKGSRARLLAGYGLTETVAVATVNNFSGSRDGSVGRAMPTTSLLVLDENNNALPTGAIGQIAISSPLIMLGYYGGNSGCININGNRYLLTGDHGYIDGDGYLHYKQRIKNIVKVSGVIVYPSEVEKIAIATRGVTNCCAIGVPHPRSGSTIRLLVETGVASSQLDNLKCEIMNNLTKQLIMYSLPTSVVFVKQLPLTEVGKVDRNKVLSQYGEANN